MRRSKGFVLSEVLMTILLQAGFILALCGAFYLFLEFYARTQQILTARNHAQRVIQFMDDKIRNAGLGLWGCKDSAEIRERLSKIEGLSKTAWNGKKVGYKLPVAFLRAEDGIDFMPEISDEQHKILKGDIVILLYAQRGKLDSGLITSREALLSKDIGNVSLLDSPSFKDSSFVLVSQLTGAKSNEENIKSYAVCESVGVPIHLAKSGNNLQVKADAKNIPAASELMYLKCIQVYTHTDRTEGNRQLAFRELTSDGKEWYGTNGYNQEEDVLEIYMTLDTSTNIFTLHVLATGGKNPKADTLPPKTWQGKWEEEYAKEVVYVSRKSWKLHNIPDNFRWN